MSESPNILARAELIQGVMRLPRELRAMLAERLLTSLDEEDDFEVPRAWVDEAIRVAQGIDAGEINTRPAQEVHQQIREEFGFDR